MCVRVCLRARVCVCARARVCVSSFLGGIVICLKSLLKPTVNEGINIVNSYPWTMDVPVCHPWMEKKQRPGTEWLINSLFSDNGRFQYTQSFPVPLDQRPDNGLLSRIHTETSSPWCAHSSQTGQLGRWLRLSLGPFCNRKVQSFRGSV